MSAVKVFSEVSALELFAEYGARQLGEIQHRVQTGESVACSICAKLLTQEDATNNVLFNPADGSVQVLALHCDCKAAFNGCLSYLAEQIRLESVGERQEILQVGLEPERLRSPMSWDKGKAAVKCRTCMHCPENHRQVCSVTRKRVMSLGAWRRCDAHQPGSDGQPS